MLLVTSFSPFIALRYRRSPDLDDLVAPPYDVISDAGRIALEERHPANAVRIDFPRDEVQAKPDGLDRYTRVGRRLNSMIMGGVLAKETIPSLTLYRMTATDSSGRTSVTTGVLGALGLEEPGTGDILPHEETTSKDKADRLSLISASHINTSPIWGLSMAAGLNTLYQPIGPPHHRAVDEDGVLHEAWIISDVDRITKICDKVASAPVVIADGHHRYETGLAHQTALAKSGEPVGGANAILALVVELAEDQLDVRAIHRIVHSSAVGVLELFERHCDLTPIDPKLLDDALVEELGARGSMCVVTEAGAWLATPQSAGFPDSITLDSQRVKAIFAAEAHEISFHHSVKTVLDAVASGAAAGVLLRPATVEQIRLVAETRTRMPAKTTFFWPKPRTGMVFRILD